jgi:formylglycine-generating enzyme required for sulfatase activity
MILKLVKLVTNREYLDFITAGGYQNFNFGMMMELGKHKKLRYIGTK